MTFKVIRGHGQGQEITSVPYRDYFLIWKQTDRQTDKQTYSSQYFALVPGWSNKYQLTPTEPRDDITLYTNPGAECDQQAIVVGRLLTTSAHVHRCRQALSTADDGCRIVARFSKSRVWDKVPDRSTCTLIFGDTL